MEVVTLASGSKGNCTLIRHKTTSLLIDAGLSLRDLAVRASAFEIDLRQIGAILISHEHIDHIRGAGPLSRAYGIPVYAAPAIRGAIVNRTGGVLFEENIDFDAGFCVGELKIEPFRVPHDAAYTVGFRIDDGSEKFCAATDLGTVTENALRMMTGCKTVLLESNHDVDMLKNGRYSYALKHRILSGQGHLSNSAAAECAAALAETGTERVILGHLSEENNTPEAAFAAVCEKLSGAKIKEGKDAEICVAPQWRPSGIYVV